MTRLIKHAAFQSRHERVVNLLAAAQSHTSCRRRHVGFGLFDSVDIEIEIENRKSKWRNEMNERAKGQGAVAGESKSWDAKGGGRKRRTRRSGERWGGMWVGASWYGGYRRIRNRIEGTSETWNTRSGSASHMVSCGDLPIKNKANALGSPSIIESGTVEVRRYI